MPAVAGRAASGVPAGRAQLSALAEGQPARSGGGAARRVERRPGIGRAAAQRPRRRGPAHGRLAHAARALHHEVGSSPTSFLITRKKNEKLGFTFANQRSLQRSLYKTCLFSMFLELILELYYVWKSVKKGDAFLLHLHTLSDLSETV